MAAKSDPRTARVPFRVVDGQLMYFYGGPLPSLRDGAMGDLVLPASAIVLDDVRKKLLREAVVPLLAASTLLLVRISNKSIPPALATRCHEQTLVGGGRTHCVRVVLKEPLSIRWRGTKLGSLEPAKCDIPVLPRRKAESLNHAYRLVSEAFEPHRRSHSANVFQEVFYQAGSRWCPLEELRGIAESDLESSLVLGEKR
jgi:hypothetical protein